MYLIELSSAFHEVHQDLQHVLHNKINMDITYLRE